MFSSPVAIRRRACWVMLGLYLPSDPISGLSCAPKWIKLAQTAQPLTIWNRWSIWERFSMNVWRRLLRFNLDSWTETNLSLHQPALRLYPVVPFNARMAITDTVLPKDGGPDGQSPLFIPKKTVVQYYVSVIHRRKDLYGDDAEEFRPERLETIHPGWQYLPFNGWASPCSQNHAIECQSNRELIFCYGSGPRICIGGKYFSLSLIPSLDEKLMGNDNIKTKQFALNEASYTTVRLI